MQLFNTEQTFYDSCDDMHTKNAVPIKISKNEIKLDAVDTIDTQKTEIYSVHGFTQNYTCFSQSQPQDINIPQRHIYGSKLSVRNNRNQLSIHENTKLKDQDLTMINDYDIFSQTQDYNESNSNGNTVNSNDKETSTGGNNKEAKFTNVAECDPSNNKLEKQSNQIQYMQDIMYANLFIEDIELNSDAFNSFEMTENLKGISEQECKININEVLQNGLSTTKMNSDYNINKSDKQECIKQDIHKLELDDFITQDCIEFIDFMSQNNQSTVSKAKIQTDENSQKLCNAEYICLQNSSNTINHMTLNDIDDNVSSHNQFNVINISSQKDFNIDNTSIKNNLFNENISTQNKSNANIVPLQYNSDVSNNTLQNKNNSIYATVTDNNVNLQNNFNILSQSHLNTIVIKDCNIESANLQNNFNDAMSQNVFSSQDDFNADVNATNDINASDSTQTHFDAKDIIEQNGINKTNVVEISQNDFNIEKMDVIENKSNETVPFKVIEELNRIKAYLNRKIEIKQSREGSSTDSGRYSKSRKYA